MTEHITTQIITATINLAGRQVVTVDTHGTGGPGSMITVRVGAALIHLRDRTVFVKSSETRVFSSFEPGPAAR